MSQRSPASIAHYVRSLWLWVFAILHVAAGLAAAQDRTEHPETKPEAAKPAAPASTQLQPAAAKPAGPATEPMQPVQPSAAAQSEPAAKPDGALEPSVVRLLVRQRDALGRRCELQHSAHSGALRLLACGPAGLWIVRLSHDTGDSAVLVSQQDLGGSVKRFFQADDRLWVEISSVRAQEVGVGNAVVSGQSAIVSAQKPPLAAAPAAALATESSRVAGPTPPRPQAPAALPDGKVLSQSNEELLVTLTNSPARPREHVALIGSAPDRDGEPAEQQIFAVGEITRSWQDGRARVALGTNEVVPLSAAARVSSAPLTAGIFAPPRAAGVWELGFLARPFLVLENLGVGAMFDAYVSYRGRAPFHVQASLTPLAIGAARAGTIGATGAFLSGAFDSRLFEVGFGVGAQTVNAPDFALNPGSGVLLEQQLRIGARDGAHLRFLSYVALFHSNFQFSSLRVEAQIPLGARTWLRLAGGGGTLGLNFGEVGLRVLMSGNGGAGSFFFTSVAGWANLYRECDNLPQVTGSAASSCRAADYSGPMLGAGGEFRL